MPSCWLIMMTAASRHHKNHDRHFNSFLQQALQRHPEQIPLQRQIPC